MSNIRVRIAPSPTGFLHIGTARTALFNYLFARNRGGKFIVRIEDTDVVRSRRKYEKNIFEGLGWLGIEADESPEAGGPFAPYRQSERSGIYRKYIEKLLAEDKAFYCFHLEKELEDEKNNLLAIKRPPLHLCEYRTMDFKEADMLKDVKRDYIIRFKTPAGRKIGFSDTIRGDLSFDSDLIGDFSIAKRPESPLYNFAVIIDDEEMKISHVIRGEDHIANTPKQILLIEALGFSVPEYVHLPLILGPDRSKLSKRHGATSVDEYRAEGYLPEALVNFMALLGWNPGDEREIFSKAELIREFSLEKVQKSGAVFDIKKLDWMNGEYIRRKSAAELTDLCRPYLTSRQPPFAGDYLEKIIALEQPRMKKLSEIGERADYFFGPPEYEKELLQWKSMTHTEVRAALERAEEILTGYRLPVTKENLEKIFFGAIGEGDRGALLWPLRVALTGKKASPGPFEIIEILGIEETLARIRAAKKKLAT